MKIGHRDFNISNKDVIFFNGSCYILMTQSFISNWVNCHPTVSKTQVNKLLKENKLVEIKREYQYTTTDQKEVWYIWYRFNI